MNDTIYEQTCRAISQLCEVAKLKAGNIVVVGCSTSEVTGAKIGSPGLHTKQTAVPGHSML